MTREAAREFIYQYLLTHACEQFEESDPRVLEFHHVGQKDMEITRMVTGGWSIKGYEMRFSDAKSFVQTATARLQ